MILFFDVSNTQRNEVRHGVPVINKEKFSDIEFIALFSNRWSRKGESV
jgi:hypothetical protein